ncbi:MAG: hypothetical protein ABIH22_00635 [Candidatus Margulisiibacteriota bacterium]
MGKLLFWISFYSLMLGFSQILLKLGINRIGSFSAKTAGDIFALLLTAVKNPYIIFGTLLMASSYFLWMAILSWFKLSIAFPLTAMGFVFVALLSYFLLGEKLLLFNYLGIGLIAVGIFLLLYK